MHQMDLMGHTMGHTDTQTDAQTSATNTQHRPSCPLMYLMVSFMLTISKASHSSSSLRCPSGSRLYLQQTAENYWEKLPSIKVKPTALVWPLTLAMTRDCDLQAPVAENWYLKQSIRTPTDIVRWYNDTAMPPEITVDITGLDITRLVACLSG